MRSARTTFSLLCFVFACLFATSGSRLNASIVTGDVTGGTADADGGVFVQLFPSIGDVGDNNHESPNLFAFNEDQNIVLGAPLTVNIVPSGSTILPIGTTVASHYVFFDPLPFTRLLGYVEFDSPIVAILTSTTTLTNSDFLANVSANYLSPTLRGLEPGDFATINATNPNRVDIDFTASSPGDYIRVLTDFSPGAVVPEPTSLLIWSLLGTAGIATGCRRRRRMTSSTPSN